MNTRDKTKRKEALGNAVTQYPTDKVLDAIEQAIQALPTEMGITLALRYGDGTQNLKQIIADARTRLEAIKNTLQTNSEGKET